MEIILEYEATKRLVTIDDNCIVSDIMGVLDSLNIIRHDSPDYVVVVWIDNMYGGHLFSYFNDKKRFIKGEGYKSRITNVCKKRGTNLFHVEYYETPQERGRMLLQMNGYSKYTIWHEGWADEYDLCNITKKMEDAWGAGSSTRIE